MSKSPAKASRAPLAAPAVPSPVHPLEAARKLLETLGEPGEWIWRTQKTWADDKVAPWTVEQRLAYLHRALANQRRRLKEGGLDKYFHVPVDIQTFIECPLLMNKRTIVWPEVMPYLEAINDGTRTECVLTGGIGVAKSTIALYTHAFQTYLLSALRDPHKMFDLDPSSEILTVFQSISKNLSKDVDYRRFRSMIEGAPYFMQHFPFSKDRESEMWFPRNVIVKPVAGHDQAAIGQNVIGAILDEVNFMAVVEKSKLSSDGGVYDQAVSNYNAIASRRESRFMVKGEVPGMLCLVSSRNYPGQFTDIKEKEARHNKRIFVYDMRIWELRPNRFKGERFRVFTGDDTRKPYILGARDKVASTDEKLVVEVPVEYRERFDGDILGALRDVAGVSTMALHPFIMDTDSVSACFGTALSIVSLEETDFRSSRLQIYPKRFANPSQPRFAHVDLAVTNDSCGLAVGHVPGFKPMQRGDEMEMLPLIQYDLLLRIRPPRQGEIEFEHVRKLLYKLRDLGLNIKWATFDTYQSIDSLQMLRQRGFVVGSQSMDEKPAPYEMTKQAFYDRRIRAPVHEMAQAEFARLEKDPKTRKIDHPVKGSKDVSDAMAGVCFGLTTRRDVWRLHGISLSRIPVSVMEAARQSSGKGSVDHAERDPNNRRHVSYAEPVVIDG